MEIFVKVPHALVSFHFISLKKEIEVNYLYAFFIFWGGKGKVESLNNNKYIHQGWTGDVFTRRAGKDQSYSGRSSAGALYICGARNILCIS